MTHNISTLLRSARLAKGLSQGELGKRVGVAQSHISKIERSDVDPQLSSVIEIARALELELRLVPRKAIPAVDSIIRTTTSTGLNNQRARVQYELGQLAATARELAATSSLPQLATLAEVAADLQPLLLPPSNTTTVRTMVKQLQPLLDSLRLNANHTERPTVLRSIESASRTLRDLRNRAVHAPFFPSEPARSAYILEDDDDA